MTVARLTVLDAYLLTSSFRTKQARIRSCECVGLRREKSLFAVVVVSWFSLKWRSDVLR